MKVIAIIFHQRAQYAVDWYALMRNVDTDIKFILVSNQECIDQMSKTDLILFNEVIKVNQFKFEELMPALDNILAKIYQRGDQTRMAVLSEFTMSVVANLRDHFRHTYNVLGPGDDIIDNFRDKLKMKKILGEHGVRLPKYHKFNANDFIKDQDAYITKLEKVIDYPMFVKPTNSAGSIGTAYIKNRQTLLNWAIQVAQESKYTYEIDEFIDGDLFHCDSITQHGKIQFTIVNKYLHPNADARYGKVLATMTMNPESRDYQELKKFAQDALIHFPVIPDGFTHMEIFKSKKNELIFLEVAARPPGAKAPEAFKIRTGGIDMRFVHLRLNLGLPIQQQLDHLYDINKWGPYAAMFQLIAPLENGIVIERKEPVFNSSQFKTEWKYAIGDSIVPNDSILDTTVSTVFWNDNYNALESDFQSLDQQQIIEIAPKQINNKLSNSVYNFFSYQKTNQYISGVLDNLGSASINYAASVVNECPSYFPKDYPNYWHSQKFFGLPNGNANALNSSTQCPLYQIEPPQPVLKLN